MIIETYKGWKIYNSDSGKISAIDERFGDTMVFGSVFDALNAIDKYWINVNHYRKLFGIGE